METPDSSETPIHFANYVVGILDVLNQGNQLRRLDTLPDTPEEEEQFLKDVKSTFGTIKAFREAFRGAFLSRIPQHKTNPRYLALPEAKKSEYDKAMTVSLGAQCFSDTMVLYAPIPNETGFPTVLGVHAMLTAAASVALCFYGRGVFFRGGIDVGIAAEWQPNEIYGPVLRSAYHLEHEVAGWPRVVVGTNATNFIYSCLNETETSVSADLNRLLAKECRDCLCTCPDGAVMVDFLGRSMHALCQKVGDGRETELVMTGMDHVGREHARFAQAGDEKLTRRYASLERYYLQRIGLWSSGTR